MGLLNVITQPTGFWQSIIFGIENAIKNYAFTVILITLIIKFVLMPFDFLNKKVTKNNSKKMAILKPELDAIKKKYVNNPQMANQKTMELYKKENYNMGGTCVIMFVYLALTMVIFITLLSALNSISAYKIKEEFYTLQTEYNIVYDETYNEELDLGATEDFAYEQAIKKSEEAVVKKYDEIKTGFLWIKSIWRPDTTASVTLTYSDFLKTAKLTSEDLNEEEYQRVMGAVIEEYKGVKNGFFLLAIISGLTTFGSMKLTEVLGKIKAKKKGILYVNENGNSKVMSLILPFVMAIFTLLYNSAFGIYIIAGSIFGLITNPVISLIIDNIEHKKSENKENKKLMSYDRKKKETIKKGSKK